MLLEPFYLGQSQELIGYTFGCVGCRSVHLVYVKSGATSSGATWSFNGDMKKPTFNPSIRIRWNSPDGKEHTCHLNIRDGNIIYAGDCTHEFANKTVPLPDLTTEGY